MKLVALMISFIVSNLRDSYSFLQPICFIGVKIQTSIHPPKHFQMPHAIQASHSRAKSAAN